MEIQSEEITLMEIPENSEKQKRPKYYNIPIACDASRIYFWILYPRF